MKVLLDECVPWPMHKLLAGHDCTTAQKRGWGGIKNGDLLGRAEDEFDLFVTSDQNMRYQQNLAGRRIAILELSTNDLRRILPPPRSSMRPWPRFSQAIFNTWRFRNSMTITENVRKSAAEQAISGEEALKKGLEEKLKEFVEKSAEVCVRA